MDPSHHGVVKGDKYVDCDESSESTAFASFNDWGGGQGCHRFVPVLGVDGTKIAPPGDLFDQPPVEMSSIRGKLANNIGDRVVLFPEGIVLMTSPGTESSYPRPPQSFKHSYGRESLHAWLLRLLSLSHAGERTIEVPPRLRP